MIDVKDGNIHCEGSKWEIMQDAVNIYLSIMTSVVKRSDAKDHDFLARVVMATTDIVQEKAHKICMPYIDPKKGLRS